MPKLTRNFLKGRMNKDVDLRLIPPGEYRDATNIQIATSEGADVGAIESVLGNIEQNNHPVSGSWQAKFGGLNTKVIGSARDTQNNKIYWFITCPDNSIDAIVEYNTADGKVTPIIIDARDGTNNIDPVLNFNASNIITGINIIDGMLFWTDNLNEPRRLNIETFKTATLATVGTDTTFADNTTSVYERDPEQPGDDTTRLFTAHDITVIKKGPESALTVNVGSSVKSTSNNLNPVGTAVNPVTTSFNFSNVANNATAVGPLTLSSAIGYFNHSPEPVVVLNASKTQADKTISKYRIVANIDTSYGSATSTSVKLDIQQMSNDIPDESLSWEFKLLEDDAVFENDMPRFSYRYKYVDGEYSPFAPFSKAAFAPGKFKYSSEEGLNSGMENNIRQIYLTGFSQSDMDVEKVEVLCKTVKSNNVYVIHEFGSTTTNSSLTLLTDKLGRVLPSNQSLRLFDAVPRKALAQEVVGNRLVYGNYLENYDLTTNDGRVTATQDNTVIAISDPIGAPSVKSGREYTIGISWLDEFGRESPVLTSSDSTVLIKRKQAAKINTLRASISELNYSAPSWATHYKWYIKESKGEYYNLALDRYYNAEDGSVWLSFPSSEINKVREGQHIFLKKEHDSSTPVLENNKFKILNIEKSVPDYLSNKHVPASFAELASDNGAAGAFQGFELGQNKITFFGPTADTAQPATTENNNVNFYSSIKEGALIEFKDKNGYGASKKYAIKSGGPLGIIETFAFNGVNSTQMAKYEIVLESAVEDTWLTSLADKAEFKAVIYHKEKKFLPEFNGRFFVNVAKTAVLEDKIGAAFTDVNALETDTDFVISPSNMRIDNDDSTPDVLENSTYILWDDEDVDNTTDSKLPGTTDNFKLFWVDSQGTQALLPNEKAVKFLHKFVPGVYFKFKYSDGTVSATNYKLVSKVAGAEYNRHSTSSTNDVNSTNVGHGVCYTLTMDKAREDTQTGNSTTMTGIRLLKEVEKPDIDQLTSTNPAVFETEPLDIADVDLFYEASGKIAKSSITSVADIDWFNCYTFGNGVESNRIRDDFNAPVIGNGVRVNAKLDEPFKETRRGSSMTFGGIINNITNINNSNQFLTAEDIFKDLNPSYGTIQKLHTRNSDLIALCEDKVIKVLANKDALFEADGKPALTATPNVLGQAVPFAGEYGISKNPESFASYGFRAYFADKSRRAVLRLSADGLTVISDKGMRNYFSDKWDAFGNNKIYGSFDERNEVYNVTTSLTEQVSFNEAANGWPTRLTYVSEFSGLSLDNQYYTFHEGKIWKHNSANRNNFYDTANSSSVRIIFNDAVDKVKRFTTLSYDGGSGWDAEITTTGQTGVVNEWKNKEGLYYNFIKGSSITTTQDFSVQGIGKPSEFGLGISTITFAKPINVSVQVGDGVYKNAISSEQGVITAISNDRLQFTIGGSMDVAASDFIYVKKPVGTFVSALTGNVANVGMTKAGGINANNELFSVSAEAFISSE